MNAQIDDYIRNGYDLLIGMVYYGPQEGLFKAELSDGEEVIVEYGDSTEEALKKLELSVDN
jgi:hypothetical protein